MADLILCPGWLTFWHKLPLEAYLLCSCINIGNVDSKQFLWLAKKKVNSKYQQLLVVCEWVPVVQMLHIEKSKDRLSDHGVDQLMVVFNKIFTCVPTYTKIGKTVQGMLQNHSLFKRHLWELGIASHCLSTLCYNKGEVNPLLLLCFRSIFLPIHRGFFVPSHNLSQIKSFVWVIEGQMFYGRKSKWNVTLYEGKAVWYLDLSRKLLRDKLIWSRLRIWFADM